MGTSLTGKTIASSYSGLIKTTDNAALNGSAKVLTDGTGTNSALYLSTTQVGIGINPTQALHISGNMRLTGAIYDSNNSTGTSGQVLTTTGSATDWMDNAGGDISGTGTSGTLTKFTGTKTIGDSIMTESGTEITLTGSLALSSYITLDNNKGLRGENTSGTAISLIRMDSNNDVSIDYTGQGTSFGGDISLVTDKKIYLGSSNESEIYHTASSFRIATDNSSNIRIDSGSNIQLRTAQGDVSASNENILGYHNNNNWFAISGADPTPVGSGAGQTGYDLHISNVAVDKDIIFQGNDNGTLITSMTLDMSEGGKVKFNAYGSGTVSGTEAYRLGVDSVGNVIEITDGGGTITGSGTIGTIPKFTGTSALGDSPITISGSDATFAGNVTIDNSSPDLYFVPDASYYSFRLSAQEGLANSFEITPATAAGGSTYSTPSVIVNYNGNVGVGTGAVAPIKPLEVRGQLAISNSSTSYWYMDRNDSTGSFDINTDDDTTRLAIDTTGNVGINATPRTSTNKKLLSIDDAWGGQLDIGVSGVSHAQFGTDNYSSGLMCRIQSADGIIFKVNGGTEGMRISSGGDSTFAGDVQSSGWFKGGEATNTLYSTNSTGVLLQTSGNTAANDDSKIRFRNSAGTPSHTFDCNNGDATFAGNVTANTGSKITSSSADTTLSIETTTGTTIFPILDFVSSHSTVGGQIRQGGTKVIGFDKSLNSTFAGDVGIGGTLANKKLYVLGDTTNYQILAEQPSGYAGLSIKSTTVAQTWSWIAQDNGSNSDLALYGGAAASVKLTVDSSGNIGIGRTSIAQPTAGATTLAIQGTTTTSGGAIRLFSSNDSVQAYIFADNASGLSINTSTSHPMVFRTVAAERMRIDSSGNVTVGSASTNAGRSIRIVNPSTGVAADSRIQLVSDTVTFDIIASSSTYTNVASWIDAGILSTDANASGGLVLNAQAGGIKFQTGTTERMRISSAGGSVGIGTTSNSWTEKLIVASANGTAYTSIPQIRVSSTTNSNRAAILFTDSTLSDGKISYYPHATEATRFFSISARLTESDFVIKGDGNVGIGTTSPAYKMTLSVNPSFHEAGLDTILNGGGANQELKIISDAHGGGGRTGDITFYTANSATATEKMRITSAGILQVNPTNASTGGIINSYRAAISVSTSAVGISNAATYGGLAMVWVNSAGNIAHDLVSYSLSAVDVVASQSISGSAAARTYTAVSGVLKVAMASGTYDVYATETRVSSS